MDGVFISVKTESIFAPASPTRHRLGCPPRKPAPRHHSGSGAKDRLLTSLVLGENDDGCSSSFACEKRRLERSTRPFSGTRPLHLRGAKCFDLQRWIWSFVVPYLILDCRRTSLLKNQKTSRLPSRDPTNRVLSRYLCLTYKAPD